MTAVKRTFCKLHRRQLDCKCLSRVLFGMATVCFLAALLLHANLNRETFNRSVDDTLFPAFELVGRQLGKDFSLGMFYVIFHSYLSLPS